jgi:hypothetical protein
MCGGSDYGDVQRRKKGWTDFGEGNRVHYFPNDGPCYALCGQVYSDDTDGTPRRPKNPCKSCVKLKGNKKAAK